MSKKWKEISLDALEKAVAEKPRNLDELKRGIEKHTVHTIPVTFHGKTHEVKVGNMGAGSDFFDNAVVEHNGLLYGTYSSAEAEAVIKELGGGRIRWLEYISPPVADMNPNLKQTFCRKCGGMESLKVGGRFVPPAEWQKHGMASDVGCVCK